MGGSLRGAADRNNLPILLVPASGVAGVAVAERGAGRRLLDPVGVTIDAVRRQVYVIVVPFLAVAWVLIAWKAGLFAPRSGG